MEGDLQQEWEVVVQSSEEDNNNNSKSLEEIENGMISFDYFSLEENNTKRVDPIDEDGSVQSGSPGWIEPRSDTPYGPKQFSELWSDSSSEDQRLVDDDLGLLDRENQLEKEEEELFDSSGEMESIKDESPISGSVSIDPFVKSGGGGGEERGMVWWKFPVELFKYCVFRVNPVWSFSMAAALVGFVVLGRRLYNMKKKKKNKNRTLQLKVLLDDKKVASHAARLNEAISIVKRVPILRPALPSPVGMNQWSMMSLR